MGLVLAVAKTVVNKAVIPVVETPVIEIVPTHATTLVKAVAKAAVEVETTIAIRTILVSDIYV